MVGRGKSYLRYTRTHSRVGGGGRGEMEGGQGQEEAACILYVLYIHQLSCMYGRGCVIFVALKVEVVQKKDNPVRSVAMLLYV